ncbi:MAG: cytochrome c3 family protein, partial [Candidatus Promineifilaceae bacterium]
MPSRGLNRKLSRWLAGGLILSTIIVGLFLRSAQNADAALQSDKLPYPRPDQACRSCHSRTDAEIEFASGETMPAAVDLEAIADSAHGMHDDSSLLCTDCHALADYRFPHDAVEEPDFRSYEIVKSTSCERCHQQPHLTGHPGAESENPVICTDCHQSHEVQPVDQWQEGGGTDVCAACHLESGVSLTDTNQLKQVIEGGLFAEKSGSMYCLACHSQPGLTMTFENGDEVSVTIDPDALHASVHGVENSWQELECSDCHGSISYPHEPKDATSAREYRVQKYEICGRCHENNYELTLDSVHGKARSEGNLEAAVCTDCHGAHDTPPPGEPREQISQTCRKCHSGIYDVYKDSVHGEALLEGNQDVPVCTNCHGVHDINDPTTELARVRSPELCAGCHADEELMSKYGISTDVFETYVADFHGETIELFNPEDPDAASNKAVCYDCHGVHN